MKEKNNKPTKSLNYLSDIKNSKVVPVVGALAFTLLASVFMALFALSWYEGSLTNVFVGENGIARFFCYLLLISILLFATIGFMYFFNREMLGISKNIVLIVLVIALVFTLSIVLSDYINIYVMPFALAAMIIGVIVNVKMGIVVNILISQLLFLTIALFKPMAEFSMASLSASIFSNLALGFIMITLIGRNYSRIKFDVYGLVGGIIVMPFVVLITFITNGTNHDMLMNMVWIFVSDLIATVLFMPILPIFESLFNVVTSYKLDELSSTNNKLLKKLKDEAPGTYNHSVMVSSIAESCAYAIGENTKLTRCAALYHDVGKLVSPEFFVENQNGYNPHDDLIPEVSVKMITQHTTNGYDIIKKYHLPEEIARVALEHHGTVPVKYFYVKAQNITDNELDASKFAYPGPKPTTKVSAIIMIADTVEAATRASANIETSEEYDKYVTKLIKEKIDLGQFEDCPITLKELTIIKDTIVKDVPKMFHTRITYPSLRNKK